MDQNFLEFWGKMFLNAAQGQRQMEEWNGWFKQFMGGKNPFINMFQPREEEEKPKDTTPEVFEMAKKATDAYKEIFKASLSMFDMISKEEYNKLLKENEELKEKIIEQERTIKDVKKKANKETFEQEDVVNNLTEIVNNQTKQFQDLMNQIGKYFEKTPAKK